jgi:hypothetical protein
VWSSASSSPRLPRPPPGVRSVSMMMTPQQSTRLRQQLLSTTTGNDDDDDDDDDQLSRWIQQNLPPHILSRPEPATEAEMLEEINFTRSNMHHKGVEDPVLVHPRHLSPHRNRGNSGNSGNSGGNGSGNSGSGAPWVPPGVTSQVTTFHKTQLNKAKVQLHERHQQLADQDYVNATFGNTGRNMTSLQRHMRLRPEEEESRIQQAKHVPLPAGRESRVVHVLRQAQLTLQHSSAASSLPARTEEEVKEEEEEEEYDELADPELVRIRRGVKQLEKTGSYPSDDVAYTYNNYVSQWANHPTVVTRAQAAVGGGGGRTVPSFREEEQLKAAPNFVQRAVRKQHEEEWLRFVPTARNGEQKSQV